MTRLLLLLSAALLPLVAVAKPVAPWRATEVTLTAAAEYNDPLDVPCQVWFTDPDGTKVRADAFWDGGRTWTARVALPTAGQWQWQSACPGDDGLHHQSGVIECLAGDSGNPLFAHGPLRISDDGRQFVHADGSPFFWLADTAWNGVLRAKSEDWQTYLDTRRRQRFTAIQFVGTQWRGGRQTLGFSVYDVKNGRLLVDPVALRRLDAKVAAITEAGLVPTPVLLWALTESDPGQSLSEDHAIALARHLVARWNAYLPVYLLGGDGPYKDVERWKRIGRAVFPEHEQVGPVWRPVTLHPSGQNAVFEQFVGEPWFDFVGYQSGHGDSDGNLRWLTNGPPVTAGRLDPTMPVVNLEPNYELHPGYRTGRLFGAAEVRRASYWSLLIAPSAGVTYGTNAIWVWNETPGPAEGHSKLTGEAWRSGLETPGLASMTVLRAFFESGPWTRLRPAQGLLTEQPGKAEPAKFVAAARADDNSWAVLYLPAGVDSVTLDGKEVPRGLVPAWFDPRTGQRSPAAPATGDQPTFSPPDGQDWVLEFRRPG